MRKGRAIVSVRRWDEGMRRKVSESAKLNEKKSKSFN